MLKDDRESLLVVLVTLSVDYLCWITDGPVSNLYLGRNCGLQKLINICFDVLISSSIFYKDFKI